MQDEMIHALALAFSYNGAHFYDLGACAQDYGDYDDRLAYMIINEYVSIIILPPFFHTGIPLIFLLLLEFGQRVFLKLHSFYINKLCCLRKL